ncbi:MAG: DUF4226 domain-containing protein [Mycobacterium sp.]|nr:DUF4226 domain-containing protein [Mycobacterium sp.]
MSEQARSSVAELRARQSALASRHRTAVAADRVLADVLASVQTASRDSLRRLDAIADEIDRAVLDRTEFAVDTPTGAHEFQRFLVAKLREIGAVVADARELGRAKRAVLEGLRTQYSPPRR